MDETTEQQGGAKVGALGYAPMFTLNGDNEDAVNVLRGVSSALCALSIVAEDNGLNNRNIDALFMLLQGATDAAIESMLGASE